MERRCRGGSERVGRRGGGIEVGVRGWEGGEEV